MFGGSQGPRTVYIKRATVVGQECDNSPVAGQFVRNANKIGLQITAAVGQRLWLCAAERESMSSIPYRGSHIQTAADLRKRASCFGCTIKKLK